ncbi:tRNA pseudouridine(38-40) synthase TruA [Belliella kenyensis]|uniref:tRNA pseudouridine synthase A n=1 Tax=Belliella kenyensis TaxID=1472724 RepID=A0ABV8EIF5_9BACT|nr:tRNA pseudouridine(38-40) synthase TruA [Belliella kenyensis]MCH7402719.1 tRNA pseudouridine(38-40) synthase TruA [Belliella kenyensis]MDN3603733.1 tRNA pseudouridine(38-40) synthase TruA [Belliella kenyensis]
MQTRPFTYLFFIQYLGHRYHGWQKQPGLKTIQGRLERVIRYVLGHENFTILSAGRTDAGVSCQRGAFELFNIAEIELDSFINHVNKNLPDDIRLLEGESVSLDFNIIQDVFAKEYRYYFAVGEKFHPFAAGNLTYFQGDIAVERMKSCANIFVGEHDFRRFCAKGKQTDNYRRQIFTSEILEDELILTDGAKLRRFCYRISGKGFLMHQVRMMMAALLAIGRGELTEKDMIAALNSTDTNPLCGKVPANGLVLYGLEFKK